MLPVNSALGQLAWSQIWQVTLLALAVGIVTRLACRHRPHFAYLLWMLVVVKCLTPPLWSSPSGLFSWTQVQWRTTAADPTSEHLPLDDAREPLQSPDPPAVADTAAILPAAAPRSAPQPPQDDAHDVTTRASIASVLLACWLIGAGLLAAVATVKWIGAFRLVHTSTISEDSEPAQLAARLARELGVRRNIRVRVTSQAIAPAVWGLIRPTVVLPEQLLRGCSLRGIEPVLAHELVHIRRWDYLAGILQVFAQVLWWFHPLVWWVSRQASRERERCCDEEVLATLSCKPVDYAGALLRVLETKRALRPVFGTLALRPVEVTSRRLEDIMKRSHRFHRHTPVWCWMVLALAGVLVLPGKALLLDASADDADTARPATAKLKEIVAAVAQAHAGVKSMKVSYYRETDAQGDPWKRGRLVFAFRGDLRYLDHTRPEGDGKLFRSLAIYDGRVTREMHGTLITTNQGRVAPVEWDYYTMRLWMNIANPPGLKRELDTTERWLPHALRRPGWKVLPDQERVDGAWCHVLELAGKRDGNQRLWLDTKVGFAYRKREFYRDGNAKHLKWRWSASNFVESAKGIWLPKKVVGQWFDESNNMTSKETILVEAISVNNVPNALFDVRALDKIERLPVPDSISPPAPEKRRAKKRPSDKTKQEEDARKQRVTAIIERLGGRIHGDFADIVLERTKVTDEDLRKLARDLQALPQLRRVRLNHTRVTDKGLRHLQGLHQLTWLYVRNTNIGDAGFGYLKGMTRLKGLMAENTNVSDEGLKSLREMRQLSWLTLSRTYVGDAGLKSISHLKHLTNLMLDNTDVTSAGLVHLSGMTKLRRLQLSETRITDAGLLHLKPLRSLETLMLHNIWDTSADKPFLRVQVTDAGLKHLTVLKKLASLTLWNTKVSQAGVASLKKALPKLKVAHKDVRLVALERGPIDRLMPPE